MLWYDYSCLPQPPRTPAEETLFRQGLNSLVACQMLGHTLILLDDAEDYLQRAWCALEALVADRWQRVLPLAGGAQVKSPNGAVEAHLDHLMADRPHLVWRALLDTEVFKVQTLSDCLRRLRLDATDPADLPFVYALLKQQGAPDKIHVDPSELLTGVLPLPRTRDGRHAVAVLDTNRHVGDEGIVPIASLDWTGCLEVGDRATMETASLRSVPSSGQMAAHFSPLPSSYNALPPPPCRPDADLWSSPPLRGPSTSPTSCPGASPASPLRPLQG
jgi:hypothetical protein